MKGGTIARGAAGVDASANVADAPEVATRASTPLTETTTATVKEFPSA